MSLVPLFILQLSVPALPRTVPHDAVKLHEALSMPKPPPVPDFRENYQETVVIPARLAAEKAERDRLARLAAQQASVAQSVAVAPPVASAPAVNSGSHEDWMAQAGIASGDFGYVDYIISHESGWNPLASNASSGAGGLPQALPYSKTGCAWGDAICQLKWADGYARQRYNGWYGAYTYWISHRVW